MNLSKWMGVCMEVNYLSYCMHGFIVNIVIVRTPRRRDVTIMVPNGYSNIKHKKKKKKNTVSRACCSINLHVSKYFHSYSMLIF